MNVNEIFTFDYSKLVQKWFGMDYLRHSWEEAILTKDGWFLREIYN